MMRDRRQLRLLILEQLDDLASQEGDFSLVPGATHKGAFRIHTPQDNAIRDIVVLRHPNGDVQAYFQSSGRSGGGYAGSWVPFEGWSTSSRVPKGLTFSDPDPEHAWKEEDITYGDHALVAKTYWNQPGGGSKSPTGSDHEKASFWIEGWVDELGGLSLPETTISDNIGQLSRINRWLWRVGAIDRSAPVLNVSTSRGRRLQFGLDEVS